MKWFFSAIDLTDNLDRAIASIRGIHGTSAFVLGAALLLVCCGLAPLAWYLDIDATLSWVEPATAQILPTLPDGALPYLSFIALVMTLLPSLIELFTARFAVHMAAARALVFGFSLFDMVTDFPRTAELLARYEGAFATFGVFGVPLFWAAHCVLLFMASFGFELLLIVFSITAVVLFMNARTNVQRRTA